MNDELPIYPLRIVGPAHQDIDEAHTHFAMTASLEIADDWQDGLFQAITTLATLPQRCVIAPESRHFGLMVRQLVYRRRTYAPVYRILFTIVESAEEPDFVRILHIRHGARRPLTRKAAAERLSQIQRSEDK